MPKCSRLDAIVLRMCIIILFSIQGIAYGGSIRKPVAAGTFYPESASELKKVIAHLTKDASRTAFKAPSGKQLKALIMPHAGYIYSGLTAARASLALKGRRFSKVVLMGPDHRVGFSNCAVSNVDAYQTPLGLVTLHADAERLRLKSTLFTSVQLSDRREHSLEVVLPFLQYYIENFELVPVVMGRVTGLEEVTRALLEVMDDETLIVVSTDLSHYLPYPKAKMTDKETIQLILDLEDKKLSGRENAACGIMPVLVLMKISQKEGWTPVLVHYSNSGDTAGGKNSVVGYSTIAFYGDRGYEKKE